MPLYYQQDNNFIMIKSSDKQFNNSYRILRVLQNKDFLMIDSNRIHYVFAQYHCDNHKSLQTLSSTPQKSSQANHSNIIFFQELIVVDGLSYLVFKMPQKEIVWVQNIQAKKLNQQKFRFSLIKQALSNILDPLLWLGVRFSNKMLNLRNFLMINGHLYFILLPRNLKNAVSLKRNQKSRSFSSDLSIGTIMEKEENIVRDFCLMIWQIIEKKPFTRQKIGYQGDFERSLLIDLITKKISLENALEKLKAIDLKASEVKCLFRNSKLANNQFIKRRSTIDNSCIMRARKKTYFQRMNQSHISKKMRTELLIKLPLQTPLQHRNTTETIQKVTIRNDFSYKRRNLSFQIQKSQDIYKTPRKTTLPIFNHQKSSCSCEKQKTQYVSIFKQNKTKRYETATIEQKMQSQTKIALMKFQQSRSEAKNASYFKQKQQKLKEKLLQKVLRFKIERFQKQVQTQQIYSDNYDLPIQSELGKKNIQDTTFLQKRRSNQNQSQIIAVASSPKENISQKCQSNIIVGPQNEPKKNQIKTKVQILQIESKNPTNNKNFQQVGDTSKISPQECSSQLRRQNLMANRMVFNQFQSQIEIISLQPKRQIKQPSKIQMKKPDPKKIQEFQDIETIKFEKEQKKQIVITRLCQMNERSLNQKINQSNGNGQLKHIHLLVSQFLAMINVLGDITASAIKNKQSFNKIQWRKSVYFLYERFLYQRTQLLINLKSSKTDIIRKSRTATEQQWQAWNKSEQKRLLIAQLQVQNKKLHESFKKFFQKLMKEDNLEQSLKQFIKNWEKIINSRNKINRKVISKYGAAIIINEYDRVKQQKLETAASINFLLDCLFGLRILSELDDLDKNLVPLDLSNYKRYDKNDDEIDEQVETLYQLFYDDNDHSKPHE